MGLSEKKEEVFIDRSRLIGEAKLATGFRRLFHALLGDLLAVVRDPVIDEKKKWDRLPIAAMSAKGTAERTFEAGLLLVVVGADVHCAGVAGAGGGGGGHD